MTIEIYEIVFEGKSTDSESITDLGRIDFDLANRHPPEPMTQSTDDDGADDESGSILELGRVDYELSG